MTTPSGTSADDRADHRAVDGAAVAWLGLDVLAVLVFASLGRRSHEEGVTVLGVLGTAAPFLVGALVGAVLARAWRDPLSWRSGLLTWGGAVVLGLAIRVAVLHRLPLSFAVVATVVLAALLLGWRAVARRALR